MQCGEPPQPLATDYQAGANPCDYKDLATEIGQVRAQGYLPIVTFQYKEGFSPQVMPWQLNDFRQVAEDGAAIISGSQSHVPLEWNFTKARSSITAWKLFLRSNGQPAA